MLAVANTYSHVLPSAIELDKTIIKSAQRVLQIFEFFADVRKPSSATEIAHNLGFPQSSTSMLLRSLVSLGYLDYHPEVRTFEPTIRLSLLGGWIPRRIDIASHIIARLNWLHEETGETVLIAEQYRSYVRYIYVLQKPVAGVSYYIKPGTLRPACISAAGRMLMTLNSEREVLSIIHRANAEEPDPDAWINRKEFLAELETCRAEGFSQTKRVFEDRVGYQASMLLPTEEGGQRLAVAVVSEQTRYLPRAKFIRECLGKAVAA